MTTIPIQTQNTRNNNFLWSSENSWQIQCIKKNEDGRKSPTLLVAQYIKRLKTQDLNLNIDQNIIEWNCRGIKANVRDFCY